MSKEAFLSTSNVVKSLGGRRSAPDPAGGAYSAPSDPLAGGQGAGCPLPKNPLVAKFSATIAINLAIVRLLSEFLVTF